jgi:hypothetical protein
MRNSIEVVCHETADREPMSSRVTTAEIWRVSLVARAGGCVIALIWFSISIAVATASAPNWFRATIWSLTVFVVWMVWRCSFVPYLDLDKEDLIVQNLITRSAIPYSEITQVKPGYYGLVVDMRNGTSLTAWAVQKSNIARWTHRTVRADQVAEAIMARVKSTQ